MEGHNKNLIIFSWSLLAMEALVIIFFGIYVRINYHNEATNTSNFYPFYQDVNVMMLIGFGFLMAFIKNHSWSALTYTFLINALVVQLYILFSGFWARVFDGGFGDSIDLREQNMTAASYSVASVLISFGVILGRVGPLELLIMGVLQIIAYTFNQYLVYEIIQVYDAGGSMAIHTFGAYFGIGVSFMLARIVKPLKNPNSTYFSTTIAVIGTFFLWMFWPSFNAGFFPQTPLERSVIIVNTIISLTGSCLGALAMSPILRGKFEMEDILNASLAGGVIIGACSGILTNVGASLIIGLFGGIISTVCFKFLSPLLQNQLGLWDTCGVHNLHGIPGFLGGILSAIAIKAYQSVPIDNQIARTNLNFYSNTFLNRTFATQAGFQVLGTVTSAGIGIVLGLLTGFIMSFANAFKDDQFYSDSYYFEIPSEFLQTQKQNQNESAGNFLKTLQ